MIGGDAFQTTDCDGLFFDAAAPAGGLARSIAYATENAGEHVGFTVDQIGSRELSLSNQAYVFGNVSMGWACPLAIDDAMIIIRIRSIGWLHRYSAPYHDDTTPKHCRRVIT
ncbi:MAG TPA: hypothetical protein VIU34_14075, partial [Steroidobacter sp.]